MSDAQPASVYDLSHTEEVENLATFAILVDNEPGVLHRLVGLFAARGPDLIAGAIGTDFASNSTELFPLPAAEVIAAARALTSTPDPSFAGVAV